MMVITSSVRNQCEKSKMLLRDSQSCSSGDTRLHQCEAFLHTACAPRPQEWPLFVFYSETKNGDVTLHHLYVASVPHTGGIKANTAALWCFTNTVKLYGTTWQQILSHVHRFSFWSNTDMWFINKLTDGLQCQSRTPPPFQVNETRDPRRTTSLTHSVSLVPPLPAQR